MADCRDSTPMTFRMPGNRVKTDLAWEIAVGVRCPNCEEKVEACTCPKEVEDYLAVVALERCHLTPQPDTIASQVRPVPGDGWVPLDRATSRAKGVMRVILTQEETKYGSTISACQRKRRVGDVKLLV
jgi:hypothetical protein